MHVRHVWGIVPSKAHFAAIIIAFTVEEYKKLEKTPHFQKKSYNFDAEVKFELKHDYFSRLHKALDYLPPYMVEKLNPTEKIFSEYKPKEFQYCICSPNYGNIVLEDMQVKALQVILDSGPDLPILVTGPFGTGKTRLLARTAYEILQWKKSCILICAHHQASVDTFVEKYFGPMIKDKNNPWKIGMLRVIPNDSYHSTTRRSFDSYFKSCYKLSQKDFNMNRLVITTLGTAQNLRWYLPHKEFFTHILIDEGAQTREPETLGPLCLAARSTKIVITGDHRQVIT